MWQPLLQTNFHQIGLFKITPWLTWLFICEGILHSTNICCEQQSNGIHLVPNGGEKTWELKGI